MYPNVSIFTIHGSYGLYTIKNNYHHKSILNHESIYFFKLLKYEFNRFKLQTILRMVQTSYHAVGPAERDHVAIGIDLRCRGAPGCGNATGGP